MQTDECKVVRDGEMYSFRSRKKVNFDPIGREIEPSEIEFYKTNHLAIVVDAEDEVVLMICPAEETVAVARAIASDYNELGFSIEKVVFVFPDKLNDDELRDFNSSLPYIKRNRFKHLAAGTRIGKVSSLRSFLAKA